MTIHVNLWASPPQTAITQGGIGNSKMFSISKQKSEKQGEQKVGEAVMRVYLVLVEIRLLHFSQGVFQVAEHELLNFAVVCCPQFLDSHTKHTYWSKQIKKICGEISKGPRDITFWDSRRKPWKSSREIFCSGLSMNLAEKAMVCISTDVRVCDNIEINCVSLVLIYLCINGISIWKNGAKKGKFQFINVHAVLSVYVVSHVDWHWHPVEGLGC